MRLCGTSKQTVMDWGDYRAAFLTLLSVLRPFLLTSVPDHISKLDRVCWGKPSRSAGCNVKSRYLPLSFLTARPRIPSSSAVAQCFLWSSRVFCSDAQAMKYGAYLFGRGPSGGSACRPNGTVMNRSGFTSVHRELQTDLHSVGRVKGAVSAGVMDFH